MTLTFQEAVGPSIDSAAPRVKEHFLQHPGRRVYRGVMKRVWRCSGWRGKLSQPFLWIGGWTHTLFSETGCDIPFELENVVTLLPDGRTSMTWTRTFHFPRASRRFDGIMIYDPARRAIVDWLGNTKHLEVDLYAHVERGGMTITSGKQWLQLGPVRLALPEWFSGQAKVREWDELGGRLGISVVIHNPILDDFFGYEGSFERADRCEGGSTC